KSMQKLLSSDKINHVKITGSSGSSVSEWLLVLQRDETSALRSVIIQGKKASPDFSRQKDIQKDKLVEAVKSSELAYFEYCFSDRNIFLSNSFGLLVGDKGKREITIPYEE